MTNHHPLGVTELSRAGQQGILVFAIFRSERERDNVDRPRTNKRTGILRVEDASNAANEVAMTLSSQPWWDDLAMKSHQRVGF